MKSSAEAETLRQSFAAAVWKVRKGEAASV